MKYIAILFSVISIISSIKTINASEISEAFNTIETRKTAMQGLWYRIKRLSPYVELKEKIDYNKDLATNDAEEILSLIQKTRNLWSESSNLSAKGLRMRHLLFGPYQIISKGFIHLQKICL